MATALIPLPTAGQIPGLMRNIIDRFQVMQDDLVATVTPDAESRAWLADKIADFRETSQGVAQRDGFQVTPEPASKRLCRELSLLHDVFEHRFWTERSGLWLAPAEPEGVPPGVRFSQRETAIENWNKAEGYGKIFVEPGFGAWEVCKTATDPATRWRLYTAMEARLAGCAPSCKDIVAQQHAVARAHNLANFASLRLDGRSAPPAAWVRSFLDRLQHELADRGRAILDIVELRRARHIGLPLPTDKSQRMKPWDYFYYCNLVRSDITAAAAVDNNDEAAVLATYFATVPTIGAALDIVYHYFNLRMRLYADFVTNDGFVWHNDVHVWDVRELGSGV